MRSLAAYVADLERSILGESLLNVEVPVLAIGSGKIARRGENGERAGGDGSQNGDARSGAVERVLIEVLPKDRLGTDRVGGDACRSGEVGDEQILREIGVVNAIAHAGHAVGERGPGKTEARAEVLGVAFVNSVETVGADHGESAAGREVREQIVGFTKRAEILPAQS